MDIIKTLGALEHLMRGAVDGGLPADELAAQVFGAIESGALYVLPNFDDEGSRGLAQAIGAGRATATNPYPAILEGLLQQLSQL